jgi:hypothetical protein
MVNYFTALMTKFLNILAQKKNNFGLWVYTATFSFFLDKDERDSFPKGVH